jgi:hypothetical protein
VVNVSCHNCDPAVPVAVKHAVAEGRDFLVVRVSDGQDKPYRARGRVYVRVGTAAANSGPKVRAHGRVVLGSNEALQARARLQSAARSSQPLLARRYVVQDGPWGVP